jgi:hypothetical protein
VFAGKVRHLRRLCLSYFVRINPALGGPFIVNAKHKMPRTFKIDIEDLFNYVHHEVHRSVIARSRAIHSMLNLRLSHSLSSFISDGGKGPSKISVAER